MGEFVETMEHRAGPGRTGRAPRARGAGFTLIELMVVIAIAAILVVIAIPSFKDMIQRNRIAGEVNSFVADLMYARAEAIKAGKNVTICPSTNTTPPTCLGTNTWQSGWMVYYLPESGGTTPTVVRTRPAWNGGDSFTAKISGADLTSISYQRSGFASSGSLSSTVLMQVDSSPVNLNARRCIAVTTAGHQQVLTAGQTSGGVTCPAT